MSLEQIQLTQKYSGENLVDAYGYDLSDNGINAETEEPKLVQDFVKEVYIAKKHR